MQNRLWDTMGIPARSVRQLTFSKLSSMPHQLVYPLKSAQRYSSCLQVHSFTHSLSKHVSTPGGGARQCAQLGLWGVNTFVWFPGRVRVLGSDFAEEAVLSNEGKGPRLSCSPGSRGLPRSLQNSAEMEFSDGQVWAAVQSPLGSCPFCFFKSRRPLRMESPPGLCSKSQLGCVAL